MLDPAKLGPGAAELEKVRFVFSLPLSSTDAAICSKAINVFAKDGLNFEHSKLTKSHHCLCR